MRDSYVPPPWDWTPCYLNEKTCHSHYNDTGMGHNIDITYDWKHFMYEDYDRALYNRCTKAYTTGESERSVCTHAQQCSWADKCIL